MAGKNVFSIAVLFGGIALALIISMKSQAGQFPLPIGGSAGQTRADAGGAEMSPRLPAETPTPTPAQPALNLPALGTAPELIGITHWVNSEPLLLSDLRGRVVIVDFWTYSCINCINTRPYLVDWYTQYADQGLVIVGVHSPEFSAEKNTANVESALERFKIAYPVGQDNDFKVWRAYQNHYWPAFYFIDAAGKIRYIQIGEGGYEQSERVIQPLLAEASMAQN